MFLLFTTHLFGLGLRSAFLCSGCQGLDSLILLESSSSVPHVHTAFVSSHTGKEPSAFLISAQPLFCRLGRNHQLLGAIFRKTK